MYFLHWLEIFHDTKNPLLVLDFNTDDPCNTIWKITGNEASERERKEDYIMGNATKCSEGKNKHKSHG